MTEVARQRLLDILTYWHNIEFFIPFDLSQITDIQDEWKLRWLGHSELSQLSGEYFSQLAVPGDQQISGYRLYVGVFDKAEIASVCAAALPAEQQFEDDERGELVGRTCFARIALNAFGEPIFDPLSVSTVPWALGQVAGHGLSHLGLEAFESSLASLKDRLQNFKAERAPAVRNHAGVPQPSPLSGPEILALHAVFTEWAGFVPDGGRPPVLLEIRTRKKMPSAALPVVRHAERQGGSQAEDEEEDLAEDEQDIDILNSFYIGDIERVIRALRNGASIPLLASYMTPLAQEARIDLYTDAGRAELLRMLHPARANRGHWLEDDSRSMSLMQQFAINTGLDALAKQGLFSVNGPPGTGKTTLLRELFAENIVRRAGVLASLGRAADAFTGRVAVGFVNSTDTTTISRLRPELTGFEMVVASSNNAAVENISHDLPKRKQVGEGWAKSRYLQTVAQRLAAEDKNGNILSLDAGEEPWGLISCALGNSKNRRHFTSKFYYPNKNEKTAADPSCRNIRQWVNEYAGPSFAQARADYCAIASQLEERRAVLSRCVDLWAELQGQSAVQFSQKKQAYDDALGAVTAAMQSLEQMQGQLVALQGELAELAETERLLDRERPVFWSRWLNMAPAREHRARVAANAQAQRGIRAGIAAEKKRVADGVLLNAQRDGFLQTARATLETAQRHRQEQEAELAVLCAGLDVKLPASLAELEKDDFQIDGLWHDRLLAGLRSALFEKALMLHEAWLAEVARTGAGFGGNLFAITKMIDGLQADEKENTALIWQSLFMVVPIVSTTFASFARQFRDLDTAALGWLFIDEAGQAVPQAAVGALWRARRAVVVGDPRQIEPVFTVPLNLIRALSKRSVHTASDAYAPDKVSVQRLADNANRYGALVPQPGADPMWIGSPLRVHRRCVDPMFSLSNAIAYDGKMVFGLKKRPIDPGLDLGPSAWLQIAGTTSFKQVVPEQIDFMINMVLKLYARDGELPAVYLISPFKAVKNELKNRLIELDWAQRVPSRPPPKKTKLKTWCKERIGTVHTFQGKEAGTVFMVLGTDAAHAGAAAWAASKPNLLNVALTRAQHYFYMVGDADVWRGLPYFSDALAALPAVPAQALLE